MESETPIHKTRGFSRRLHTLGRVVGLCLCGVMFIVFGMLVVNDAGGDLRLMSKSSLVGFVICVSLAWLYVETPIMAIGGFILVVLAYLLWYFSRTPMAW